MLRLLTLSALFVSTSPFFFGTGGGCNCAPACAPAPICAPPPARGAFNAPVQQLPQVAEQPQQPVLPQSPVYSGPQVEQVSWEKIKMYPAKIPKESYVFQIPQAPPPPPQDVQPIAPQPPQQPVGGNYQVPEQPVYQPQAGPGPMYQPGPGYQTGPGPVYQPGPGPVYQPGPGPAYQQPDGFASLQHEAAEAAAAGSKNEEVIEEQDNALEKSGKGKVEMTTVEPAEMGTSTIADVVEEKMVDIANLKLTDDPLCNSEELRKLMLDNIDENLNSSKRLIQLAAEAQFGGRFDVICANGDFSYVTNTELFCQETKGDVSCYTYRQL
ncbi:ground-like domain protein [Ancylostoma ceylanicum]|uniref:Ground-like domain protein n=1 Tax=Ancylostoma ceylanicum TaxID=53326 RepID=A0A0D6LRA6_9BILA|nr:ground-like domain protein [Ancylostoma ceylanicum]